MSVVIVDLLTSDRVIRDESSAICIIGAGAAGIYLATRLAAGGSDVIVVEAGGEICGDSLSVGFDSVFSDAPYLGATNGRQFGLGGTTSRWGGLLLPHTRHDLRDPSAPNARIWSYIVEEVAARSTEVLGNLGHEKPGRFFEFAGEDLGEAHQTLHAAGFDVAASLFLPFKRKNLSFLLKIPMRGPGRIRVFLNAVVNSWTLASEQGLAGVRRLAAVSREGHSLQVSANRFFLAAGAIESSRILLEIDASVPTPVLPPSAAVGCYLADHLSVSIAEVAPTSRADAVRMFAPRFSGDWMRTLRFIEECPLRNGEKAFAHFIFDNENPGFALAKEVLGAIQGRRRPRIASREVASGILGLFALGWTRYANSRLYVPMDTPSHLQLDIEQMPIRNNCVSLGTEKDRYGRRSVTIRWNINEADLTSIREAAERILRKWPAQRSGLPTLLPRLRECSPLKPHDAYHPVGTCRMGYDAEAVVDQNLKVAGMSNLWVVTTGVFPSAGTANPTFSMLCLAESLVSRLSLST